EVINEVINRTNLDKSELKFSLGNEILLPSAGEDPLDIGSASALLLKDIAIGRTINILRPKVDSFYSSTFVSYYINQKLRRKISRLAKGVSISNVYNSDLKTLNLNLPSLPEQQKIASFLTSVDKRISQLKRKKQLLEQYKKGIMQQIFSQELRFRQDDGSNYPDWEQKKLGEIFSERSERKKPEYELLSVTMNEGVKKRSDIEGKDNSSDNKDNYKVVEANDLVYNSMRMWQGASGVSPYMGIISPAYTVLMSRIPVDMNYWGYLFKWNPMVFMFRRYSQGLTSDTWNLKYPQLSTLKTFYPSIEEQTKIANFLSAIDAKISQTQQQIALTQQFKKGLLQQMFV
ncbi:MAG: restriction endonuclease subunit S, partial [Bacteroidia bacterium]